MTQKYFMCTRSGYPQLGETLCEDYRIFFEDWIKNERKAILMSVVFFATWFKRCGLCRLSIPLHGANERGVFCKYFLHRTGQFHS